MFPAPRRFAFLVSFLILTRFAFPADEFMHVRDIKPGMKGYGLTVFSGTTIERFDVEVISVMKQAQGKMDLILIRMSGGPLAHSGIVAGMSGSPIYLNDKLIGAVAYGWTFAKDPIAGVTPIHEMLTVLKRTQPPRTQTAAIKPPPVAASDGGLKPIATPLMVSGVPMRLLKDLEPAFDRFGLFPVQSGGGAPQYEGPPPDLKPGSAVAAQLIRGDMDMSAVGTVTYRSGDHILAFGHPMFQGGDVDLPMAEGYVHLTLARQDRSYKLAGSRAVVGKVSRDYAAAIGGEMGKEARMVPCKVTVTSASTGQTHTYNYNYEMIHDKMWTPRLIQIALANSIATTEAETGEMMLDVKAEMHVKDRPDPVRVSNTFFDASGFHTSLGDVYSAANDLINNGFRQVAVERIVAEITVRPGRETASIETARVVQAKAIPGKTIDVVIGLRPYKAKELIFRTVQVRVPETLQEGYVLPIMVSDARTGRFLAQALRPGAFRPSKFSQVVKLIEEQRDNKSLVVHALLPDLGLTAQGETLPSLPSSFLAMMGGSESRAAGSYARGCVTATVATPWVLMGMQSTTVVIGEKE
ncbi:MAG: SpoIVB peptidase S55 domain-containing protein [Planctomycetota bacterium]